MREDDIVKRARKILGSEEEMKICRELYELTKKLKDRINEIEDINIRSSIFYAVIAHLSEFVKVNFDTVIATLETVKFDLLRGFAHHEDQLRKKLLGE